MTFLEKRLKTIKTGAKKRAEGSGFLDLDGSTVCDKRVTSQVQSSRIDLIKECLRGSRRNASQTNVENSSRAG